MRTDNIPCTKCDEPLIFVNHYEYEGDGDYTHEHYFQCQSGCELNDKDLNIIYEEANNG